ncbi:serine/threonine protein kinase [Planctomicrobium sp. SH668]|uniref:serine/threonine protein kinase n=1 Tax=Planctomicrobium sp. SH668 TaxID=3448126 RepID=UPI003F5C5CB0
MSELGFHQSHGSSEVGLTFIRPLPQGKSALGSEAPGSGIRQFSHSIAEKLFPSQAQADHSDHRLITGVSLGHFQIEERIGRGGMGAVFRAVDKRLGRVVAVKVLTTEHSSDPEAVQRFENEARAAAKLDHENIARVHYIGEDHGMHFIAFEFVQGANVRNLILQKGRLSSSDAINYVIQIAEALRQTSAANVVHRDIKPSNIIITPSGRAKLVDLGLARQSNTERSQELTSVGTALGTFDYIAPEQAMDARKVDVRSDIYSLGCTLYHMLTGSPPYPTGTMFEKVMNHHSAVPPNPMEKNRSVTPKLARICQKMMSANPEDRYPTPESLISDLVVVADEMGLEPTTSEAMIWRPSSEFSKASRWNGIRTWSLVALVLLALVAADQIRSLTLNPSASTAQSSPIPEIPIDLERSGSTSLSTEINVPPLAPGIKSDNSSSMADLPPSPLIPFTYDQRRQESLIGSLGLLKSPLNLNLPEAAATSPKLDTQSAATKATGSVTDTGTSGMATLPTIATETNPPKIQMPTTSENSASVIGQDSYLVVNPSSPANPNQEELIPRQSLAAACAIAKDGWIIELPANFPILTLEESIQIVDKKIQIRPSRHQDPLLASRPLLRVDLSAQRALGSLTRNAQMFAINRGAVEVNDFDIEMIVAPNAIADWSMVSLINGSRFISRGCTFTMVNPANVKATLIDIPFVEASDLPERMPDRMLIRDNSVELVDSICRGQFDFAVQQNLNPFNIVLQNTAIATSGSLLRMNGSDSYAMSLDPDDDGVTTVSMNHVTMITGRGLLYANSGLHGSTPRFEFTMNDSVASVISNNQIKQPFIELSGNEETEFILDRVHFQRQSSPSYVSISGPFCLIDSITSLLPGESREMSPQAIGATQIQVVLENLLQVPVGLKLTDWHRLQPIEFELHLSDGNPAIGLPNGTQDAGVNWEAARIPTTLPEFRASSSNSK